MYSNTSPSTHFTSDPPKLQQTQDLFRLRKEVEGENQEYLILYEVLLMQNERVARSRQLYTHVPSETL